MDTELLIGEVEASHPFVQREQMMPFMPIVRVPDVWTGIDMAIEAEHGYLHTAVMHSKNVENLMLAGRDISATHFALANTRVMLTCAVIGHAAGTGAGRGSAAAAENL